MVVFSQYTTPMDRNYGKSTVDDNSTDDIGVGIEDIGMSIPMGIAAANVQGIAAKIKQGAGAMEIQFPGAVRGTRNAHTPGMFGDDQRQAIRELAGINEVNLTTHASFGIMGLAGMDQQGNFSKEQKKVAVDEIKRAIEFAADTAQGGSVVVHTGEFQRPISEESWAQDPTAPGGYRFKHHGEEEERAIIRVVDDRTGQIIQQVRKNMEVARPIWLKSKESYIDENGTRVNSGDFIDYEGRKIAKLRDRVPEYDKVSGRFKVVPQTWNDFVKEAKIQNEELAREKRISVNQLTEEERVLPEEAFLKATLQTNEGHSKGWALQYAEGFDKEKQQLDKLKQAYDVWRKIEEATPESERWKLSKQETVSKLQQEGFHLIPKEGKMPTELIEDEIRHIRHRMEFENQASTSQQQQALDSFTTQQHVKSARKYALGESFESYAEAGLYAMDVSRAKKFEERPLMVTMENIFPESYGGHPQELKNLVLGSRRRMAEKLQRERNMSAKDAKKAAETHIKATLDTAHLNTWRKYWQNDPKKSMNENDSAFKKWFLNQVEDLSKNGIIGNVHLSDNYGYQDDHLAPGQGTTPVKEAVAIMKKYGYKGALTVEPGADASTDLGDFWGLMKTWKLFGSPVYGAHGPARMDGPKSNWSDIHYSYFGQTRAPYYVFGGYAPSQDWTLWSQTPFE